MSQLQCDTTVQINIKEPDIDVTSIIAQNENIKTIEVLRMEELVGQRNECNKIRKGFEESYDEVLEKRIKWKIDGPEKKPTIEEIAARWFADNPPGIFGQLTIIQDHLAKKSASKLNYARRAASAGAEPVIQVHPPPRARSTSPGKHTEKHWRIPERNLRTNIPVVIGSFRYLAARGRAPTRTYHEGCVPKDERRWIFKY